MIGELWWNRLVNSVRFLDDIQIAVMNEKSVVLFFDDEIPWQDIMIETICLLYTSPSPRDTR